MDPNVCPVCTLYLREGITLYTHLNTHPKDQVIEALVRCASIGVPGSICNESNESVQDPLGSSNTSIETPTSSVHHFASPVQTLPNVPSSGPVPVSSPFGIAGSITLPNGIPSLNPIGNQNHGASPVPSLQPFAIGLGSSSGNQYASTFAYQQFCGGGDGGMGGTPLLLAMSPQQQYAAYSSSSSSSNSVLQMVFNPYAVDPVIGSQGYPAPGLIAGIGIGPTLQTCQQVQTNVLQQVVTASPIVATPIPAVPSDEKPEGVTVENNHQIQDQREEIITDELQYEQAPMIKTRNHDECHPAHELGQVQNAPTSSNCQLTAKKDFNPTDDDVQVQRRKRRTRSQTKSASKSSSHSKRHHGHCSGGRNSSSLRASSPEVQEVGREEPKKTSAKVCSPKHTEDHANHVYDPDVMVIDQLESNSNKPEKSGYEKIKKQFQSKSNDEQLPPENCSQAITNGDKCPSNGNGREAARDANEWVNMSLYSQNATALSGSPDPQGDDDADDDHYQDDICFGNDLMEQPRSDPLRHSSNGGVEIIVLNQWDTSEQKKEEEQISVEKDPNDASERDDVDREKVENVTENESEAFSGDQKEFGDTEERKAESWDQTGETTTLNEISGDKGHRFERQMPVTNEDVMAVGQGENANMNPERECRENMQECRPHGGGYKDGNPANGQSGNASLRPAPGDTEDALPAPPSPVNIFQIDGMNIILSSRLIEQTDKMRERLGIFEGLGPMAGSYGDISIPEGILEEEGLVVSDIIADEAMPPRGELSGQEGMGSGSNCSDPGPAEEAVPKSEGSTVWTSGGFSNCCTKDLFSGSYGASHHGLSPRKHQAYSQLFPVAARQGGQCDLLPSNEAWCPVEGYKASQEPAATPVVAETVPKKKTRAKKNTTAASGASKANGDTTAKAKAKRLYHCWTCLEVFNCPKERRVHQREKHGGEKTVSVVPGIGGAVIQPSAGEGQDASLVPGEVGEPMVKSEVREAKVEPKDPPEVKVKETRASTDIPEESKDLADGEVAKLTHACSDCDRSFPSLRSLTAHRRAAHRDSRFKCPTCAEKFLTSADFTTHVRTIHPLECSMCGKQFCRQQNLRLHLKRHLSVRPYKCTQCDKAFVTNQKMEEHLNSHTGRTPFQCPLCPRAFRRHSNLIQHRKHHHLKVKRKVRDFFCHCGAVFHSVKKLEWHKETHEDKPKTCPHCSDRFVHKAGLTRHIRQVHDRRYVPSGAKEDVNVECPVCSAVYLKSSLHIHMRVHSGERPFSCGICGKGFATKWNLQLHRWVHASPHSKPFKCATCKAAYHRRVDYVAHVRSHRKVRPYVCNTCGRRFMRKYNCVRHSREHETGKAFECTICQKRFHRRYYLKEHLRIHTGLRPYVCHVCGKASGTKSNMNKHVRIHHAREPVNTEG